MLKRSSLFHVQIIAALVQAALPVAGQQKKQGSIYDLPYPDRKINAWVGNGILIEHLREPIWMMIYKWDAWQPQHHEPRFLLGNDLGRRLRSMSVTVPVMVLTGDADAQHGNQLLEAILTAKQVFIKNAGHVSNIENPQGFNEALLHFLDSYKRKKYE